MKIVIFGGTGLIGTKLSRILTAEGHTVTSASPSSGVDVLTGAGITTVLEGADVVVDVMNSPSFEDAAVLRFFETAAKNMLPAEEAAGIKHHVALSVVGATRNPKSGYLRAKVAQEKAIAAARVPFTIVSATQFFEFIGAIADSSMKDGVAHVSSAKFNPISADDVAAAVARVVSEAPLNGHVEIGGPELIAMDAAVRLALDAKRDLRRVVGDPAAVYFGTAIDDTSLTPGPAARLGTTTLAAWLARPAG